jgi:NAD(P)-dependent dehydrogenase (short-subunit alcohol dehydrogenase family)
VAFVDNDETGASELIGSLSDAAHPPHFLPWDVTDVTALRTAIAGVTSRLGDVEVLINNVANDERRAFGEVEPDYFDWSVSINLRPHYFAIQSVIAGMRRRGGGSIVNIGSISWRLKNGTYTCYATLKSAAMGLTRSLARDLGKDRIRVNHVMPGWVMTDRQRRLYLDEAGERSIRDNQCLPDFLMPCDVASLTLFLAADDSRMITAQDFVIDGGWT